MICKKKNKRGGGKGKMNHSFFGVGKKRPFRNERKFSLLSSSFFFQGLEGADHSNGRREGGGSQIREKKRPSFSLVVGLPPVWNLVPPPPLLFKTFFSPTAKDKRLKWDEQLLIYYYLK